MPHDFEAFPELTNNQMSFYYFDSPHRQITESFMAKVEEVTDGDTIRVSWSERDFTFPVRFANINAPELNNGGEESKAWLKGEIEGEEVEVLVDNNNRVEKYGRLLGTIIYAGLDMNQMSEVLGYSKQFGEPSVFGEIKL